MAIFIFLYGASLFVFGIVLQCIAETQKRKDNSLLLQKYEQNIKFRSDVDQDYANTFESRLQKIASPINGFIKKEYLDYYLTNETKNKENQTGILIKIQPVFGGMSEEIASECGKIINIEFNGNSILACEEKEDGPNYIFWVYLIDMNKNDGEIFVLNAIQRLISFSGQKFNYAIMNTGE